MLHNNDVNNLRGLSYFTRTAAYLSCIIIITDVLAGIKKNLLSIIDILVFSI
jgi:hypothetical protein